jgi:hypothetical protein
VNWNWKTLQELKRAQADAIRRGAEVYIFHGQELLVGYAKYLIEHLEAIIPPPGPLSGFSSFGAGRLRDDWAAELVELGFRRLDLRGGWRRDWIESYIEVIQGPSATLRWFTTSLAPATWHPELLEQVVGAELEDLEEMMVEADYFDEHGTRMPRGRTFHGYER